MSDIINRQVHFNYQISRMLYVTCILIHFRTNTRQVPFYISVMVYELRSLCCNGYLGNANDPEANPRCVRKCIQYYTT